MPHIAPVLNKFFNSAASLPIISSSTDVLVPTKDNNVSSFNRKKLSPSLKRAYQRFIDNTEFNTEETTYKPRILTDREIKENEEYWAHIDELMCLGNGAY